MTEDTDRKLENLIFLHLRRKYTDLYYFDDNGECDFIEEDGYKIEVIPAYKYLID